MRRKNPTDDHVIWGSASRLWLPIATTLIKGRKRNTIFEARNRYHELFESHLRFS